MTIEERACSRKVRYGSKLIAEETLAQQLHTMSNVCAKRAYYCAFCDGWHLSFHVESNRRAKKIDKAVRGLKRKGRIQ